MNNCIFCKIINNRSDSYIITETDNFLVFLDIHPRSPGHSLVVSKKHYQNLKETPTELGNEFLSVIKETILILNKSLKTSDFTIGINEGPLAGQVIMHLHLHIIPRFKNDKGGSIHSVVFNKSDLSLEEIYKKIKQCM